MTLNWDWILGKKNDHKADEDYAPIIENLARITCYICGGVFWIDDKYNPNAIRYKCKPGRIMKNAICCPYCGSHLSSLVLKRQVKK